MGVHTCDRRSSKTVITEAYPTWVFEDGFKEEDELWKPDLRETNAARLPRARSAMDDIWGTDGNTHISISSHSGMIASLLECEFSFLLIFVFGLRWGGEKGLIRGSYWT